LKYLGRDTLYTAIFGLVLTIFNHGAYLTFKSIFHKALKINGVGTGKVAYALPWHLFVIENPLFK